MIRVNPNGTPDTDFGVSGKVITPFDNYGNQLKEIRIQSDNKIVAAGTHTEHLTVAMQIILQS